MFDTADHDFSLNFSQTKPHKRTSLNSAETQFEIS